MVTRPVFAPEINGVGVKVFNSAPFIWHSGFSLSQGQKNIEALHAAIIKNNADRTPLEISSKSKVSLGVSLSAFNLGTWVGGKYFSVESVYQASKVFAGGVGPFPELYGENPGNVRDRIRNLGNVRIVAYRIGKVVWELDPTRAFYDWVYCRALYKNPILAANAKLYNCFTDIAFNPVKSVNCQAYAVSLYLSFEANGVLEEALSSKEAFLRYHPVDIVNLVKTNNVKNKNRRYRYSDDNSKQMNFGI